MNAFKRISQAAVATLAVAIIAASGCKKTTSTSSAGSTEPPYEALANAVFSSLQNLGNSVSGAVRAQTSGSGTVNCLGGGGGTIAMSGNVTAPSQSHNPYNASGSLTATFTNCASGGLTITSGSLTEAVSASVNILPDPDGIPPTAPGWSFSSFNSFTGSINTTGTVNMTPTSGSGTPYPSCSVNMAVNLSSAAFNESTGSAGGTLTVTGSVCGTAIPSGISFNLNLL